MHVQPIDEKVRDLLAKIATADETEATLMASELRTLLHAHLDFVRGMIFTALVQDDDDHPAAKAAD